jgi:hypothetical protein
LPAGGCRGAHNPPDGASWAVYGGGDVVRRSGLPRQRTGGTALRFVKSVTTFAVTTNEYVGNGHTQAEHHAVVVWDRLV